MLATSFLFLIQAVLCVCVGWIGHNVLWVSFEGGNALVSQVAIDSFQLPCGDELIAGRYRKTRDRPPLLFCKESSFSYAKKPGFLSTPSGDSDGYTLLHKHETHTHAHLQTRDINTYNLCTCTPETLVSKDAQTHETSPAIHSERQCHWDSYMFTCGATSG